MLIIIRTNWHGKCIHGKCSPYGFCLMFGVACCSKELSAAGTFSVKLLETLLLAPHTALFFFVCSLWCGNTL